MVAKPSIIERPSIALGTKKGIVLSFEYHLFEHHPAGHRLGLSLFSHLSFLP
jgi:hypothetical protein